MKKEKKNFMDKMMTALCPSMIWEREEFNIWQIQWIITKPKEGIWENRKWPPPARQIWEMSSLELLKESNITQTNVAFSI